MSAALNENLGKSVTMPRAGEVYWANFPNALGSQQGGTRPFIVVSNDTGNKFSSTVAGIPMTTKRWSKLLPIHVRFAAGEIHGIPLDSVAQPENYWVINKFQLGAYIGQLSQEQKNRLGAAFRKQAEVANWGVVLSEKH